MLVGRSDCSIIKNPHFGSPPHFSKYFFFFGPRPSLQKITNANTNTKIIFWRQTKTEKMTCIFFIERWLQIWHLADSLLTPCWHLVDTLLTPCWSFFQMCNCTIVTTWHSFAMLFFHCQMFSCKVDFLHFAVTKYFLLTSLMFTAIIEQSISTLIFVKEGVGIRIQSNKPFSHKLVIGMLKWLSLIMITKTD